MKRFCLIAFITISATACSTTADSPLPTDRVRDAASAISIAVKVCGVSDDNKRRGKWTATFDHGVWSVAHDYFTRIAMGERVRISAATGKPDPCDIIVTAT
jgi:hypothetical protein